MSALASEAPVHDFSIEVIEEVVQWV